MARFGDIRRGDELKAANDALQLWQRKTRAEKKTAYAAAAAIGGGKRLNRGSKMVFVQPFGAPDNFWYQTKALAQPTEAPKATEENATSLITAVAGAVSLFQKASVPIGPKNMSVEAKRIKFAMLRCTEKSGTGIPAVSRLTGMPYTKYNTNTASSPFGSGDTIKTQSAVETAIRGALLVSGTLPAGRSISFSPQGDIGSVTNAPAV